MRLLRAGIVCFFALVLVLAGLAPVLYCLALVGWQAVNYLQAGIWGPLPASLLFTDHPFRFLPEVRWGWLANPDGWPAVHQALAWSLARLHAGVLFALPGLVLVLLGARIAIRQIAGPRKKETRRDERPRDARARRSREPMARVEPFIGPDDLAAALARHRKPPPAKAVSPSVAA